MRYICSECSELIKDEETITREIDGRIMFLCKKCLKKWFN